jgi:hypothetical protein
MRAPNNVACFISHVLFVNEFSPFMKYIGVAGRRVDLMRDKNRAGMERGIPCSQRSPQSERIFSSQEDFKFKILDLRFCAAHRAFSCSFYVFFLIASSSFMNSLRPRRAASAWRDFVVRHRWPVMVESCKCCAHPRSWREICSARDFKFEISDLRSSECVHTLHHT